VVKTIYFPEGVPLRLLKRLVVLGPVLIACGSLPLLIDPEALQHIFSDQQGPFVLGAVLITLGVSMSVIGAVGLVLRESWKLLSMKIEHNGSEVLAETGQVTRGDHLAIRLELKALKASTVQEARCRLLVEEKRTSGSKHSRSVYENVVEDRSVKGQTLRAQKKLSCTFEQPIPLDVEPSSNRCFWSIEVEVGAKGAPRFLHRQSLTVA
jgi:hypothetical protein